MNITGLAYFGSEWQLVDLMKSSSGWFVQSNSQYDTGEQDQPNFRQTYLDSDGWVRALPAGRYVSAILAYPDARYPAGDYTVLYDGEGRMEYIGGGFTVARSAGRDVLTFAASPTGFVVRITSTDPNATGNYLRNIRVLMPGATTSQRFHPRFLEDLRRYKTIRFMDFLNTNRTQAADWNSRTKLSDAHWTRMIESANGINNGAPPESAIELAQTLGADAWVNMPVRATDDYILGFARMAHQNLSGTQLKVYVEYSNENWNSAYPFNLNGAYVQSIADATWPGAGTQLQRLANQAAKRTVDICRIWKQEWGADSGRVKCVMGGWTNNTNNWNTFSLACSLYAADRGGRNCAQDVDYLATAPYMGAYIGREQNLNTLIAWTNDADGGLDKLFQELEMGGLLYQSDTNQGITDFRRAPIDGALNQAMRFMQTDIDVARSYGLQAITYESGEHLVGVGAAEANQQAINLFVSANRDARMGVLVGGYLSGWGARGGQLLNYFKSVSSYGRYGSSGTKEYQEQTDASKYNAIQTFIDANPCAWPGCAN